MDELLVAQALAELADDIDFGLVPGDDGEEVEVGVMLVDEASTSHNVTSFTLRVGEQTFRVAVEEVPF